MASEENVRGSSVMNLDGKSLRGVTAVADAFQEAYERLQSWRKGRKQKKSGESELLDSLEAGGEEVKSEYQRMKDGSAIEFQFGDEISTSSLFRAANDIKRRITDVLARAELVHGHAQVVVILNPSDLWQISEKIRKSVILSLRELDLRIRRSLAEGRPFEGNVPRLRQAASSISMRPAPQNFVPASYAQRDVEPVFRRPTHLTYEPPTQYSAPSVPSIQTYNYQEYEYKQSRLRMPTQQVVRKPLPEDSPLRNGGLPPSLQVGIPFGRPLPPIPRQRPVSYNSHDPTGTGFISRYQAASPGMDYPNSRPGSTGPQPLHTARDGKWNQSPEDGREYRNDRNVSGSYSPPEQFNRNYSPPTWHQQPVQPRVSWSPTEPPRQTYYVPVSSPQEHLEVSPTGHFRMPTPVNHGGYETFYDQ